MKRKCSGEPYAKSMVFKKNKTPQEAKPLSPLEAKPLGNQDIKDTLGRVLFYLLPRDLISMIFEYSKQRWSRHKQGKSLQIDYQHTCIERNEEYLYEIHVLNEKHVVLMKHAYSEEEKWQTLLQIWKYTPRTCVMTGKMALLNNGCIVSTPFLFVFDKNTCSKHDLIPGTRGEFVPRKAEKHTLPFSYGCSDHDWVDKQYILSLHEECHENCDAAQRLSKGQSRLCIYNHITKTSDSMDFVSPGDSLVASNMDQQLFAVGSRDTFLSCYGIPSSTLLFKCKVSDLFDICLFPDRKIAFMDGKTIQMWDIMSQTCLWTQERQYMCNGSIHVLSDASVWIEADEDLPSLNIRDTLSGTLLQTFAPDCGEIDCWTQDNLGETTTLLVVTENAVISRIGDSP